MARAIEQIERDMQALEKSANKLFAELNSAYTSYCQALGQATRQQLILASYQVCTQAYPKQFLSLSMNQRQQLQRSLRQLGQTAAERLLELLNNPMEMARELAYSIQLDRESAIAEIEQDSIEEQEQIIPNSEFRIPNSEFHTAPSNPLELVQWQQILERAIAQVLKTLSLDANQLLQKSGILPQKLPAPLLEAATAVSEATGEMTAGPPNVMNLLIETENPQDLQEGGVTQLIAIQLRLSEVEFADTNVRTARNQVRQLESNLVSLGREYQKRQRERTIAEAEAAWRASWFDE
ncbi:MULTISPECIES: hypothetical protein [Chroococcidiopsis]|uniref:Uncharacterized protein n=1 Tax=Chroococcidiopsis thermalis (strain PCC 7203) TaxID=251229 RepID=K9TY94_CHRTP|nr:MULTISPECIES: hypothetical protein [Chroococcidiopsis]AFY87151.1 hypothetical protein Chro_1630 [Chroococcidiopsis thermalis PCC 7203]MBE9019081.1 hypothetical protein [Chroococcidiopsidales cyanobacterium LEGE 13417]PSM47226.1 hypothetical protein C7Y66_20920 [Chroococcidiopsis sp. CCALA 051]